MVDHIDAAQIAAWELLAQAAADAAADAVMPYFRSGLAAENKADNGGYDPVTLADRAAEVAIRGVIASAEPSHGFFGEEYGSVDGNSDLQWVVDPIDGTRAFVLGLPTWGTLIALQHRGRSILGVMAQPFTRERFWSGDGQSWFRGPDGTTRPLKTRTCTDLSRAMLSSTHPDLFAAGDERDGFRRVLGASRDCRYGGDCYAYCLVAMGLIDLVVEAGLKAYDVAALVPIIEGAGGIMTTWDGRPADGGGRIIAAGDALVHAQALALLAAPSR
jgi:myo-inositol-1(or 4)-monophosphatase